MGPKQPHESIDRARREFVQATSGAFAAGLVLPYGASVFAATNAADPAGIDPGQLAELRKSIKGTVVSRTESLYEPWRHSMIWNWRKFERYPDVIVQAEDDADVVATVNFARRHRISIKPRTGGHCWSGSYLRDDGILLDLSRFQTIEIDTAARKAVVGAGVISRNLAYRLGEVGLAFPIAHSGMVPIAGFLLGGGLGWNANAWGGISVFNIEGLDVVTPDGEVRYISAESHPDLFWAARGAGSGLFFAVLRFYLKCYPLPAAIDSDTFILPEEEFVASIEVMDSLGPELSRSVEMLSVIIPAGDTCVPGNCPRAVLFNAKAFADSTAETDRLLAPLRQHPLFNKALHKEVGRTATFEQLFQEEETGFPQRRGRADNILTNRAVEAAPLLNKHLPKAPSTANTPVILYLGETEFPDAAYSAKGKYYMSAYAQWDDPADDAVNAAWLRAFYDEMNPYASGFYINEMDREARPEQIPRCFAPENWKRIHELRQQHDPEHVFHDFPSTIMSTSTT